MSKTKTKPKRKALPTPDAANELRELKLRERAQSVVRRSRLKAAPAMTRDEIERLVHELQVHQVELVMQNDELRRGQAELAASHDRYRELYDFSPAGYLTTDGKSKILELNLTAARMFGLERGKLIGRKLTDFIAPVAQDIYYHHRQAVFRSGKRENCELKILSEDGSTFDARLDCRAFNDPASGERCVRTTLIDVSERSRLESAILKATESERKRIGLELHDNVNQYLIGVAFMIRALDMNLAGKIPDKSAVLFTRLNSVIEESMDLLGDVIRDLLPLELGGSGLMRALHHLAETTSERFDIPCVFECPRPVTTERSSAVMQLYRIAQEAVNNAVKHSGGSRIEIGLTSGKQGLNLSVRDWGKGIRRKGKAAPQGSGIKIMNYRAALIGAQLNIMSEAGHGTRINCKLLDAPSTKSPKRAAKVAPARQKPPRKNQGRASI